MSGEKEPKKGVWRAEHELQPIAGRLKKIPRQEQAHFDELDELSVKEMFHAGRAERRRRKNAFDR